MKKQAADLINKNGFFVSLLCFVAVLPFSEALVSILSGVILFVALAEDSWENKWRRFNENRILLFIPAVYLIYLFSSFFSGDFIQSLYDLRKNLFFIVLPLAFLFGKEITARQKRFVLFVFSLAIIISTILALIRWKFLPVTCSFDVHKISLISHIRFSFQLVLAFWFFVLLIYRNHEKLKLFYIVSFAFIALYLGVFLLFQQSLTGLVAFITSALFFVFYFIFQARRKYRIIMLVVATLLISIPVMYVSWIIFRFYDIENVDEQTIDLCTKRGNNYRHDFDNPLVENGHYVYLYVCDQELREEWNNRSKLNYDSAGVNGYPVRATLLRYLSSKGLRKDAQGVQALTENDVKNIEKGVANVIFENKKYSLYPRIYQTIWEYYVYSETGYANNQSLSQRIEFAKAALTIIKKNFWFGVGTGNWKEEFKDAYKANNSKLDPVYYASAHNQYLNYMVKFGFAGFLVILFFLTYPVIKTKRYTDFYFLIFLVFMFFVNFADSNFETHMGSSFFVFFYSFFLSSDGCDYLNLMDHRTVQKAM